LLEDLQQLTRALGCPAVSDKEEQEETLLSYLLDTLVCINTNNGSILLESQNVKNGSAVKGIPRNQVHVPESTSSSSLSYSNTNNTQQQQNNTQQQQDEDEQIIIQREEEIEDILERIRKGGLISADILIEEEEKKEPDELDRMAHNAYRNIISGSLSAGFQLGLRAGPFCEEPIHRVAVVLEAVEVATSTISSGTVVGAFQRGMRCALLSRPARLVESCFRMTLHSSLEGLSGLYSVLNSRYGRVLDDDVVEGTNLLKITAVVPQAESLGMGPQLLSQTRGEVTVPEWEKYHQFQLLPQDPFWIPTSLDEREDYGDYTYDANDSANGNNSINRALLYIRQIRARKGLLVDSTKTVVAAEKQRTIKR